MSLWLGACAMVTTADATPVYWPSRTLSWTRFHADLCWYPPRPTRTNGRCLLWFPKTCGRRGTDNSTMPTTLVALLSLLQRARAEDAAFSPLALSQRNRRPVQNPPRPTTPVVETGKGRGSGEAAGQRADAAWSTTVGK
jgi:hypothetical protein